MGKNYACDVVICAKYVFDFHFERMSRQMSGNVGGGEFTHMLLGLDRNNIDCSSAFEDWHSVRDGASGVAAPVPTNHDAIKLDSEPLNIRNDYVGRPDLNRALSTINSSIASLLGRA